MARGWVLSLSVVLLLGGSVVASAQQDFSKVEVTSEKLAEGVYMLQGAGGNIGLRGRRRRVPDRRPIRAAHPQDQGRRAPRLTSKPREVRAQHALARVTTAEATRTSAKSGTLIVAHENVRKRMSTEQFIEAFGMKTPAVRSRRPARGDLQPIPSPSTSMATRSSAFHVAPAHTDGDTVVQFRKANVLPRRRHLLQRDVIRSSTSPAAGP